MASWNLPCSVVLIVGSTSFSPAQYSSIAAKAALGTSSE
jgi:hypothetical protein